MIIELDLWESGQGVVVSEAFHVPGALLQHMRCFGHSAHVESRPLRPETAKTFKVMSARHDMTGVFIVLVRLQDLELSADKASHPGVRNERFVCYLCSF